MSVEITDEQDIPIDIDCLRSCLQRALGRVGMPDAEVSVLLTGDSRMAELNQTYRDLPETTDVLSFPMEDNLWEPFGCLLGDIVISVPTARQQAAEGLQNEVESLALHGLLHLLGHDHEAEGWESWNIALKELVSDE